MKLGQIKKLKLVCLIFAVFLLNSCEFKDFSEGEMKGVLTVDLAQMGNKYLEVRDLDQDGYVRFIYPGKKILQLDYKNLKQMNVTIMDSRRVKLARFTIPQKYFDTKSEYIAAKSSDINQLWAFEGKRFPIRLRTDRVIRSGGHVCKIPNCTAPKSDWKIQVSCTGVIGPAWDVTDYRYDYHVRFISDVTGKDMGTFVANGEIKSEAKEATYNQCTPDHIVYLQSDEIQW